MGSFMMTIDGVAAPTEQAFGVINPATGEVFAEAPECSRSQLDAAMESAAKAFVGWRVDEERRREMLLRAADALEAAAEGIGAVLTSEQGKPLREATGEVRGLVGHLRYYAALQLPTQVLQDDEDALSRWCAGPSAWSRPSRRGTSRSRSAAGRSRPRCSPGTPWC